METTLPVREAAARTNTSIHTLRYYERIGLIRTTRAANGHRQYFEHDLGWIRVLTCLRATGMPIQGMLHFAQIVSEGEHTVPARQEFLEHHRNQVRAQIAELEQNLLVVSTSNLICTVLSYKLRRAMRVRTTYLMRNSKILLGLAEW